MRGSVRSRNVILFLESLLRRIHRRIIVIWDNIGIHRSREVTSWLKQHRHRITVERLPAYACELNADEGVWQYLKGAPLGNYCPRNIEELAEQIRKSTRKLRRRSDIVRGFFRQTPLAKV